MEQIDLKKKECDNDIVLKNFTKNLIQLHDNISHWTLEI